MHGRRALQVLLGLGVKLTSLGVSEIGVTYVG